MPGAQRKHLIDVSYHLDEKENMLTGKPPKLKNNNATFHDGLLFGQTEESKCILTRRDPGQGQERESRREQGREGEGIRDERGIPAFRSLSLSPSPPTPPPPAPCHPGPRNFPGA